MKMIKLLSVTGKAKKCFGPIIMFCYSFNLLCYLNFFTEIKQFFPEKAIP